MNKTKRWKRPLFLGCVFLAAAVLLQAVARLTEGFGPWYVCTVYPVIAGTLGRLSGLVPFSVSELLLYLLFGIGTVSFWRLRREKRTFFSRMFCLAAALFFSYTACCGVNYFGHPFSVSLHYQVREYSAEELELLVEWLTEKVNESYREQSPVSEPAAKNREAGMEEGHSIKELSRLGAEAMENLAEYYPALRGYYPRPKPLMVSWLLSVQQLAGVYSPFTVEANYNREMTPYNIPHTICHELSHLRGFMREDEANFIGVLACIASEDAEYRRSGYLSGWIYAGNALAGVDFDTYVSYWKKLCPEAHAAFDENREFWSRYESKVSQTAETVNHTYLKANRQKEGVHSYGRAVDLMLAWYLSGGGRIEG